MKKASFGAYPLIVNGTVGGHPFVNVRNHASRGAVVAMPVRSNVSAIEGRKLKSNRPAVVAANAKGAV